MSAGRFQPLDHQESGRTRKSGQEGGQPSSLHSPSLPVERILPVESDLRSWLQVLGAFLIWTNSWGLSNAFGVFQTYYQTELLSSSSPDAISWVGGVQAFLLLFVGVISGPVYDAGHFKELLVAGNFMVVFGLMMTSLCSRYYQVILAHGVTCGIGYGLLFTPGVSVLPQYFVKRRVLASGIAATGSGFGGLVYPIIFRALQPQIGFGWATRTMGFLSLAFGLVTICVMHSKNRPGKMRQLYDYKAFSEAAFTLNMLGLFFALAGLYIPFYYIGTYSLFNHSNGTNLAFYLVPIMNAGSIFGRLLPNFFADKIGVFNNLLPCLAIAAVLCFCWIAIHNAAGLIVFAIVYGFFSGTFLSLPPTAVAVLTKDMSRLGTRTGTTFGTACFGVLVGTPISGAILRATKSYVGLQVLAGCLIGAAALCVLLARVSRIGLRWEKM